MHLKNPQTLQNKGYVFFDSGKMNDFVSFLMTQGELIAAHKKGEQSYVFRTVQNADDVVLDYPRTIQPLKKFFLPPKETLLNFNMLENDYETEKIEIQKRIFFGVHSYELQAVHILDYNFKRGNPESNYLRKREQSLFIGISYTPDDYHFGKSVGLEIEKTDGMCLYIEPLETGYYVFVIDDNGLKLLQDFSSADVKLEMEEIKPQPKEFKKKIKYHYNRLPQVFDKVYNSKVWEKVSEKCVGCGTCNLLCPTCYCFDVRDEIELDTITGKRERFWDGCMLNTFAEAAGGENFRDKLHNRTRHRLFRKFKYITEHSNELSCVGCGRCTSYCPANISIIEIINNLIEEVSLNS